MEMEDVELVLFAMILGEIELAEVLEHLAESGIRLAESLLCQELEELRHGYLFRLWVLVEIEEELLRCLIARPVDGARSALSNILMLYILT